MQQQINLYRYLKKAPTIFLTNNVIFVIYGIFTIFLLLDSAVDLYKKHDLQTQVNALTLELDKQQKHLAQVKLQYPTVNIADLEGSMQKLKQDLSAKGEMAAILSQQTFFSTYLIALGNSIVKGVWLTDIDITKSGQKIVLKGMAVKATFIQPFVDRLRKQAVFNKMDFSLEEINQNQENQKVAPYVSFIINVDVDNS